MFGSASRKNRHIPPPRPESDPTTLPYNHVPVIPIPPYLIAPHGFPTSNNVVPNLNPASLHPFNHGQVPPSNTSGFSAFQNSSPYSDSNSNLYDANGPPVIPVPDGKGGFILAGGFNPDGTLISQLVQPPSQQQQSATMNTNSHQAYRLKPEPSTTSTYQSSFSGPMPPPPPRTSWATGSGPSPWVPPTTPAPNMGPVPAGGQYSIPYVMPPLHGPQLPVAFPPIHNTTEMTRDTLLTVLDHFSETLEDYFDLEPLSSVNGTPPHRTPPHGAASGSGPGNGNGEGSSSRPPRPFSLRMAVHGGACMLLHQGLHALSLNLPLAEPSLQQADSHGHGSGSSGEKPPHMSEQSRRTTTRDVDILLRGFIADYGGLGPPPNPGDRARRKPSYPGEGQPSDPSPDSSIRVSHLDAESRMKACIRNTARVFPWLGLDWMNADADVALPLAAEPETKQTFDPIHRSTFTPHNESVFTIYTSPNKRLTLVGVPPYWAIALKIARWGKRDWADVGILLRAGTLLSKTRWTEEMLMAWLTKNCWAMGYSVWEERRMNEMRERIQDAIDMIQGWEPGSPNQYSQLTRPQAQERTRERGRDSNTGREHIRNWAPKEHRTRSKSRARSRSISRTRRRSLSRGPTEIFIPPDEDEDDLEFTGGYRDRDFEPRGRAHHRPHHSFHNQLMRTPALPHSHGPSSGPLSQATAIAPFFPQPQNHSAGSHNTRPWRRQASRSRNRDNKKGKKTKLRDRQRRLDHQWRDDRRSEWHVPSDSESETESEESEDDSSEDDDEEDKENRDRRRAWMRANIYAPPKKRPTPLKLSPAPAPAPSPFNPFVQQHRPPTMAQPQLQPHPHNSRQPTPFPPPPSPGAPPMDAGPAELAQYQFERQMLSLESERRREKQVRDTIGRVAGRVMARGSRGG